MLQPILLIALAICSILAFLAFFEERTWLRLIFAVWLTGATTILSTLYIDPGFVLRLSATSSAQYIGWVVLNCVMIVSGVIVFAAYGLSIIYPKSEFEQKKLYNRAWSYWQRGHPRLAQFYLLRAIRHAPNNYAFRELLGATYQETKNWEKAIHEFEDLIRLDPEQPTGYIRLGVVYILCEDLISARTVYENGLAIDPENSYLLFGLGEVLSDLDEKQQSLDLLQRAFNIDPSREQVRLGLAAAYADAGRVQEALKIWQNILASSKDEESREEAIASLKKHSVRI